MPAKAGIQSWIPAQGRNDCHACEGRHPVNWIPAQDRREVISRSTSIVELDRKGPQVTFPV